MLSLTRLSRRMRHQAREEDLFFGCTIYTGDVYDESRLDAELVELGASFDGGTFGDSFDCYGQPGDPKPPCNDDSAMPGLGAAGSDLNIYTLASKAWMHANCSTDTVARGLWLRVLDEYRRGVVPSEELIQKAQDREHILAMRQWSKKR